MKLNRAPEVCSGTYFPRRGRPRRGYYVMVDEIVVAGPFRTRGAALEHLEQLNKLSGDGLTSEYTRAKHLDPAYARTIASVLRKQEKTLTAAMGGAP